MEYFVFEGPEFTEKQDKKSKDKKRKIKMTKVKSQQMFYVFRLEFETQGIQRSAGWKFVEQEMKLEWIQDQVEREKTRYFINHDGVFSLATSDDFNEESKLKVRIQQYKCNPQKKLEKNEQIKTDPECIEDQVFNDGKFDEIKFEVEFDEQERAEKLGVINKKINVIRKREQLKIADKRDQWKLNQLLQRISQMESVWITSNHIIVKSGSNLKYIKKPKDSKDINKAKPVQFNIDFGPEVWIQDIFETGVDDLIQIFLINDYTKRIYAITWNLQFNREHSNFQSTFDDSTNPEYLLLRTYGKYNRFNTILDHGAVVNLANNLPIQFFDQENEFDWCPKGELKNHIFGQKKIQEDNKKYLELTHPGRIQHFTSYSDWEYWVRFEQSRGQHELQQGRISSISPLARFPTGISLFHIFSTNVKVLSVISNFLNQQMSLPTNKNDARINMLPLLFLHSDPTKNKPGQKTTPIHLALDKQSPMAFEIMLGLLKEQNKVCVTSQLLDRLEDIVNQESPVVIEFFDQSFFITDQFLAAQSIDWGETDSGEQILAIPGSFMTKGYLQKLVQRDQSLLEDIMELDDRLKPINSSDNNYKNQQSSEIEVDKNAPVKYCLEIEELANEKEESSTLRQVQAKLLEFNWIFTKKNASKFITVLSDTDNDEIFATNQIRVLIDFLWQGYFWQIYQKLFVPFAFYLLFFSAYVTYLSKEHSNEFNSVFCIEWACLIFSAKFYMHFLILESIQITKERLAYFTDFWNLMDFSSLILNALYVYSELNNTFSENTINLLGAICIIIMWTKMFYWMRIFKPFAAFIRIVSAIVKHISVFSAMLLMVLIAFANCIMVLQLNRHDSDGEHIPPIFDGYTNIIPLDAIIHAYLTGLGDFNKDNYSEHNGLTVWVFFLMATFIVQLVFMNLLIAMMGDAYAEIMAIQEQSIMKELCSMMEDNIWMLDIGDLFQHSRYILWLTPDSATQSGSMVERQITQLQEFVEDKVEQSDTKIMRELQLLREDLDGIKTQLTDLEKKDEEEEFY